MKKLLLIVFIFASVILFAQNRRFVNRVYNDINRINDWLYCSAAPTFASGVTDDLLFDFYSPGYNFGDDTMAFRPLVIEIFGGSFIAGNKNWCDMTAFADTLCHYGYAVASIEYRLGFTPTIAGITRATYRATQDVNAAIRYFKEYYDVFGVDTNQIYLLGMSAGAIAGLHSVFLDEEERPAATYNDGMASPDLGCINCSGNFPNHTNSVAGVIAEWGGLLRADFINTNQTTPVCMIHGTADATVLYDVGPAYPDLPIALPTFYGSHAIALYMDSVGMDNYELHAFEGEPHAFYLSCLSNSTSCLIQEKLDTCVKIALKFLAKHNPYVIDDILVGINDNVAQFVDIYPNPAENYIKLTTHNKQSVKSQTITIMDLTGKIIEQTLYTTSQQTIDVSHLPAGIYFAKIENPDFSVVRKFIKK